MSALNHSVEVDMSAVWRAVALKFARDLEAERAKLRRWQLRLRWRAEHDPDAATRDRIINRADFFEADEDGEEGERNPPGTCEYFDSLPIAGPRGVLP